MDDPATILSGSRPHILLQGSFSRRGQADTGEAREARTFSKAVPASSTRSTGSNRSNFIPHPAHGPGQDSYRYPIRTEEIHNRAREGFQG